MRELRGAQIRLIGAVACRIAHNRCRKLNQSVRGPGEVQEIEKYCIRCVGLFIDFTPHLACPIASRKTVRKRDKILNRLLRGISQNDTRKKSDRKVIGFAIARTPIRTFSQILKNGHTIFGVALPLSHASPKGRALWLAPPGAPPGRFPPEVGARFARSV